MEKIEYRRMFEMEERHWWFQSRLLMTEGMLRQYILPAFAPRRPRLLDLGCGTGLFLQRRAADCEALGLDYSLDALKFSRARGLRRIMRGDAVRLPIADASLDAVSAFDLIEHVAEDQALVNEIWRVLRPGGFLLASVPAHPSLWSAHDVSLHHHRRYTRKTFEKLFAQRGWQRIRQTGSFSLILPIAALKRWSDRFTAHGDPVADTKPTPALLNRLLIGAHRLEAAWLARADLPTGLSLLTVRRKPV